MSRETAALSPGVPASLAQDLVDALPGESGGLRDPLVRLSGLPRPEGGLEQLLAGRDGALGGPGDPVQIGLGHDGFLACGLLRAYVRVLARKLA